MVLKYQSNFLVHFNMLALCIMKIHNYETTCVLNKKNAHNSP